MCLFNAQPAKRAEKNITVFKVLRLNGQMLFSPHRDMQYFVGRVMRPENKRLWVRAVRRSRDGCLPHWSNKGSIVEHGLHSHGTQKLAKECTGSDLAVFKAIIPKGAVYIRGTNHTGRLQYASSALKIIERVV